MGLENDVHWPGEMGPTAVARGAPPSLKIHQCFYCPYSTHKASHLRAHSFIHTGEKPFSCPFCQYKCTHQTNLKAHIRKHTGEKPFACMLCPYRSTQKANLNSHMLKHKTANAFVDL